MTPPLSLFPRRRRRIHDGGICGLAIEGAGTKGRLEGCDIARNGWNGVDLSFGADPLLVACK